MGKSDNRKRKRERRRQQDQRSSAEALAYSSVSSVEPAPTEKHTSSPRTPNSFFSSSYSVKMTTTTTKTTNHNSIIQQIVHRHVNGLCIVTIGNAVPKITSIEYMAKEAPAFSNAQHRKRQTKMLNGCVVDNTVTPSTILAHLRICDSLDKNGEEEDDESTGTRQQQTTIVPIFACVFGTILELNYSITPKIITEDPLLDGYIAIILPTGNFPPFRGENSFQQAATVTATAGHQNDQDEKKKKKLEI